MTPVTEKEFPTVLAPELSVIVPVHDERVTPESIVDRLRRAEFGVLTEVQFADFGCTHGSREILQALPPWHLLLQHAGNTGKGAPKQTGLEHADAGTSWSRTRTLPLADGGPFLWWPRR